MKVFTFLNDGEKEDVMGVRRGGPDLGKGMLIPN
jgi:hypothetical protein